MDPISSIGAAAAGAPVQTSVKPAGAGFDDMVQRGLENVSELEHTADAAVQDLASGGPTRLEDVMIATSQAQLGIELLSTVRDRALAAYQEVMRLPV